MTMQKYKIKRQLRVMPGNVTVYEAEQAALRRKVEIRVLNQFVGKDSESYLRFEREFKTIARLDHPNIVKIFDWGLANDKIYYVAERRPSVPLDEYVAEEPMKPELAFRVGAQIAKALGYLHGQQVVHRDISPSSIYYAPDKELAYIAHFTMVKNLRLEDLTAKGVGHVAPLAFTPEQARGQEISEKTDFFLLGALVFKILTGQDAFDPEKILGASQATFPVPRIESFRPGLGEEAQALLEMLMAAEPSERPEDAKAVEDLMNDVADRQKALKRKTARMKAVQAKAPDAATPDAAPQALPGGAPVPISGSKVDQPLPAPAAAGSGPEALLVQVGLQPVIEKIGVEATLASLVGSVLLVLALAWMLLS